MFSEVNPVPVETVLLASASPRRRTLLAELGVTFGVQPTALAEPEHKPSGMAPGGWAQALAYFKARAVAQDHEGEWVLGADTIVVVDNDILNKPANVDEARRMLVKQAGRWSDVITGVALVRMQGPCVERRMAAERTRVWMRDDPAEREAYLDSGDWAGKAGAYGIQDVGDRLVDRIVGSFANVVGLPVERLRGMFGSLS